MFGARPILRGPTHTGTGRKSCGATAKRGRPLGGGTGYTETIRPTGPPVGHLDELIEALAGAKSGDTVYVSGDAVIECTERIYVDELVLALSGGVTLASDRGIDGAPGGLIRSDAFATRPLVQVTGADARVTGLRLQGPNPRQCLEHHSRSFREGHGGHEYYYKFPTSDGIATAHSRLRVDNCELAGWSHSAIRLNRGDGHLVQHNFIHHNQYQGLGYGISHDIAESVIEGNLFDANRHSIAGTGRGGSGYEARHNVELGRTLSHCFDMHGGRDRKDGTDVAGGWMHVHHNTFRADRRCAIVIRGTPEDEIVIDHNWFRHKTERGAMRKEDRVVVRDNAWGLVDPVVR
ncbi:MAG TPA: hypothetical protein DIC52_17725 [Candidatus Latescibacteria bacterium]|nr:hypothetical protein [Candidatus Latescibacterota bacterium]